MWIGIAIFIFVALIIIISALDHSTHQKVRRDQKVSDKPSYKDYDEIERRGSNSFHIRR